MRILLYGKPNQGKSCIAYFLEQYYVNVLNKKVQRIIGDELFIEFMENVVKTSGRDKKQNITNFTKEQIRVRIQNLYYNLDDYVRNQFKEYVELQVDYSNDLIIIDWFNHNIYCDDKLLVENVAVYYKKDLNDAVLINSKEFDHQVYSFYSKLKVQRKVSNWVDPKDIEELSQVYTDTKMNEFITRFLLLKGVTNLEKLKVCLSKSSYYQSFPQFGYDSVNSKTNKKLEKLQLSKAIKTGSVVLDVGCNAGAMLLESKSKGAGPVYGIDTDAKILSLAKNINKYGYNFPDFNLICSNILTHEFGELKFDVIICASVFHYFRDGQQPFFRRVSEDLLKPGGTLVLEVGLYKEGDKPIVHKYSRRVDYEPCHFPNDLQIKKWCSDYGLKISWDGPSVLQLGDPLPRHVYHIVKEIN